MSNKAKVLEHKRRCLQIIIHIVAPVCFGIIIYGLFRELPVIDRSQIYFPLNSGDIPDWVQYNLPDGLWLYALLFTLSLIWHDGSLNHFFIWVLLSVILSFLTEAFQALNFFPGVFDWKDMLAYSVAIVFFLFNSNTIIKYSIPKNVVRD
jgi:hypothetical protein